MRDAKLITDFTLTAQTGQAFEILGTYLAPHGQVYLKLKYTDANTFINYQIGDFTAFLSQNKFTILIEPTDSFENKNFAATINQSIEV